MIPRDISDLDATSRQLKDALELGKTIIVTTLQKFPMIAGEIGELPGKRFAMTPTSLTSLHGSTRGKGRARFSTRSRSSSRT